MDEIRPWLFIGNSRDTTNKSYLNHNSIQAILQLAIEVDYSDIKCSCLPVEDFAPLKFSLLEKGVAFVREQKKVGNRVLVACSAGINRSSAFCTAALKEEEELSLLNAFKEIKSNHPSALPIEPVWISLCNYYNEAIPYVEALRLY